MTVSQSGGWAVSGAVVLQAQCSTAQWGGWAVVGHRDVPARAPCSVEQLTQSLIEANCTAGRRTTGARSATHRSTAASVRVELLLTPSVTTMETCARSGRAACMAVARLRPVAVEVPAQLEVAFGKEKQL